MVLGSIVPERVWPLGTDNAMTATVLECLSCAHMVHDMGGAPYQKDHRGTPIMSDTVIFLNLCIKGHMIAHFKCITHRQTGTTYQATASHEGQGPPKPCL